MNVSDIVWLRLSNQYLSRPVFTQASAVVSHLGAVQAQDFAAAKWSLGFRMKGATDIDIEKAYDDGEILRTHVMRPTWHFVLPEHIRWMLTLTAPQVKRLMGTYNKKLELDEIVLAKARNVIVKALTGKNYLTRQELKGVLRNAGIATDVQRLAHIVMDSELDGVICSGPRIGKQFTYALIAERISVKPERFDRDKALAKLAFFYFTSHGPAQLKDFSWWSGLSIKDATKGLDAVKSELTDEIIDGKTYWFLPVNEIKTDQFHKAYLLSIYDEYIIAYTDRTALGKQRLFETFFTMGNIITGVVILDGLMIGSWKRIIKKNTMEITLRFLNELTKKEYEAVAEAGVQYGAFHQMEVKLIRS